MSVLTEKISRNPGLGTNLRPFESDRIKLGGIVTTKLIPQANCKNRLVALTNLNCLSQTHLFLTNFIWSKQPKYWLF